MSIMHRLRAYHALLVVLVVAAYASGELGFIHAWLGYSVALVIVARLLWAATGVPQLGLMRFYPQFEGLKLAGIMAHPAISRTLLLGIGCCLIGVTGTGLALDRGRALGLTAAPGIAQAAPDAARQGHEKVTKAERHRERESDEGTLSEVHEVLANLLTGLVGLHVLYLLLFKRPLARFMLFLDPARR